MDTITANGTKSVTVVPGMRYVFHVAGTWASATVTLKWSDGTTAVTIQAQTADAAVEFVAPTNLVQVVTSGTAGCSLLYGVNPVKV